MHSFSWKKPDWKVRERAAMRIKEGHVLLQLVLEGVSEEVRGVATSKPWISLRDKAH